MEYYNIYDMHTHSLHSFDGHDSCEALCKSALGQGAGGIAVTDHCDIDGKDIDIDVLCTAQLRDLKKCINTFSPKLEVLRGIEIGQGIYRKKETEYILKKYSYDFVLGSLHNLENMEDFYFLDYKKFDVYELLNRYFEGLLELSEWGAFDSLAHLTYPLRYIIARDKIDVDLSQFNDIIDGIFEQLIKNDKALEINTSGLFMDMKDTLPNISYVKRFKALGGKYITVGSDSHYADKVLRGIHTGYSLVRAAGFDSVTIFREHNPIQIKI